MAVVGSAYIVVSAITTGFNSQVNNAANSMQNSFSNAGKKSGKSFAKSFASGLTDFQKESMAAYAGINALIKQSYYLQGALGLAIPAIGAVAGGLSVMAFQAAAAAPSFIALGGVMAGLVQGMIGVKLAFGGIGKAVGAIGKPGGGVDRMPQLLRAARDATDALADSEKRLKKTMEALTEAREEARREIENLKYGNEDAVISEKRAVIELEKARQSLLRVQDLPPNSRARREAELAYAEADLNLRRSRSNVNNLNKDLDKATQGGTLSANEQVENSKRVVDANEAIADATKAVTRAAENKLLADKELADAKAGKGGGGGGGDPFAGLNDFQIEFAKFLAGLKPQIAALKLAVSAGFLPDLQRAIELMDTKLFPILERRLKETGVALGKASMDFAKAITSPAASSNFDTVLGTGNYVISRAGEIVGNLSRLLLALLAAADPLIRRFTDFIERLTGGWADDAEANMSGLTEMFNRSGDIAADFGAALGNIVGAFINIGKAIAGSGGPGDSMTGWLINITQKFEDFTAKHLADGKLQEYFQTAFNGFKEILIVVGSIVAAILKTGGEKSFEGSVKTVGEGVSAIIEKIPELVKGGAAFAGYVSNFLKMTSAFIESGSVKMFFGVVSTAMGVLVSFLNNPIVAKILGLLAAFHGLKAGILAVSWVLKTFVVQYIYGAVLSLVRFGLGIGALIGKLKFAAFALKYYAVMVKNSTIVQAALNFVMNLNPITLWIIGIMALIAILAVLYFKFDGFRNFVDTVFNGIKTAVATVIDWLKEYWPLIIAILLGPFGLIVYGITKYWDQIVAFVMGVVGRLRDIGKNIWSWITDKWTDMSTALSTRVSEFVAFIRGLPERVRSAAAGMWNGIANGFKSMLNSIIGWWNNLRFDLKIPKNAVTDFLRIGGLGFTLDTPNIPPLAKGGVVMPSVGGTLARIGEAGRPERIEPLDDDGLSKRDRAIISMLAGGGGGQTFNVYPAPKMDEEELAALVSRQLAFQLRAGSV